MILADAVLVVKGRRERISEVMSMKLKNRLDDAHDGNLFPYCS
jgi:hypothetical protein